MISYGMRRPLIKTGANKGFTLVELLVSVGIFVLVTSVAVYNNGKFNSSVVLTNLAYEIALSVRQSQFYGITVKSPSALGVFESGFGMHFDQDASTYVLFEDKDPNLGNGVVESDGVYQSSTETLQSFSIKKGNKIGKIYLNGTTYVSSVDVSFKRPNPDALIKSGGSNYNKAEICVVAPSGEKRKILVEVTGQISVVVDNTTVCN